MLMPHANTRFFLCQDPVNMHKSFEGLSAIVQRLFPGELLSGAFFIFLNRTKDQLKVLSWDGDGFIIFQKRLEKGSFTTRNEMSLPMQRRDFLMLLEGVVPKRLQSRFFLRK
jgi:transposase